MHRGRGLAHATLEVSDRDHDRLGDHKTLAGEGAEALLDRVDFLEREQPALAFALTGRQVHLLDPQTHDLGCRAEELGDFRERPASQDLAMVGLERGFTCALKYQPGLFGESADGLRIGARRFDHEPALCETDRESSKIRSLLAGPQAIL